MTAAMMKQRVSDLQARWMLQPIPFLLGGFLLAWSAAVFLGPAPMTALIAIGLVACAGVGVIRFPLASSLLWFMVAGTTPEMWVADILPGSENTATALVKMSGLVLVVVCILRYGFRSDPFNPGIAFVFMFMTGLGHGLHPALTVGDSLRSLIGGAAPFSFSFSRLSRNWCRWISTGTIWIPTVILLFGLLLTGAGIRPMYVQDDNALRLAGSTHPAFLGSFAMTAIYASLIELCRDGRRRYLAGVAVNFLILLACGARSPLFCAVIVTGFVFLFLRSEAFTIRSRVVPIMLGLLVLPLMIVVAVSSDSVRLFDKLSGKAGDLSGRDVIWPFFRDAWNQSPWFGWGVGAGKVVVDPDSLIAHLLGTTAAHNEYLRIGVDGGYVGLTVLILLLAAWTIQHTRRICRTDRLILRLVMLCFAIQSATDNTLIAATASILFTWMSAVFARAQIERDET